MSRRDVWLYAPTIWCVIGLSALLLSACTLINQSDDSAASARDQLTARIAETQQAQAAALELWDRVIVGEIVSCQEYFTVPQPLNLSDRELRAHPNAPAIQTQLNAAIQAVRNSADLWNIECADARPYVPLSMAREGRATALAASEPLAEAARLLIEW